MEQNSSCLQDCLTPKDTDETITEEKVDEVGWKKKLLFALWISLCGFLIYIFVFNQAGKEWAQYLFTNMKKIGPIIYPLVVAILTLLGLFGAPVLVTEMVYACSIGESYAVIYIMNLASRIITSVISFFVARYIARDYFASKMGDYKILKGIGRAVAKQELKMSFLLRFSFIPIEWKNYLIALLNVSFINYMIPSLIHPLIFANFTAQLGKSCMGSSSSDNPIQSVFTLLLLLVYIFGVYYMTKSVNAEIMLLEEEEKALEIDGNNKETEAINLGTPTI